MVLWCLPLSVQWASIFRITGVMLTGLIINPIILGLSRNLATGSDFLPYFGALTNTQQA